MINDSNLEIYADPINYDLESGRFEPEGTILLELASQVNGPVLELGCGTGRVTIPLAERGIDMTGLELLPHMLEYAQDKAKEVRVKWVCADVRSFQLETQYGLIFTKGAVFQHLLTIPDQEAMLSRVREHLDPEGRFIIDVGFKHPNAMVNVTEEQDWYTFTDVEGREVQVAGTDQYDHLRQIWYQRWSQRWIEDGRQKRSKPVQLALRYIMPQEMEALLYYNGFEVLARYGDWEGNPLSEDGYLQVYVCTQGDGREQPQH